MSSNLEMDHLSVLDLRYGKRTSNKSSELCTLSSFASGPLDLRISKDTEEGRTTVANYDACEEYIRPSVITPNLQFSRSASRERFRWNHRSHPSIDSDSSFESEHENDFSQPGPWIFSKSGDAIDISITASRCSSIGSVRRRESMSSNDQPDLVHTDTENDNDVIESSTSVSSGYYKELPALTANVSIGKERRNSMIFKLSSCQAELIDPEDVRSELINSSDITNSIENDDDSDEINDSCLQICETETYFEELLKMQTERTNEISTVSNTISAGIQETASKYIKEIRKTKSDMFSSGLNLEIDGNKKQYCMKCNDEFYSIAALLKHLMTHSSRNPGEKLIKCPVCTKRFSTLNTLEHHILRLHTGDMKFVCEICEAPFKFRTHLRKHMLTSRCGKGVKKPNKGSPNQSNCSHKAEEETKVG